MKIPRKKRPPKAIRELADKLNALEEEYAERIKIINFPVIELLSQIIDAQTVPSANHMTVRDFLKRHPISSLSQADRQIIGEIWKGHCSLRPNIKVCAWAEFIQWADLNSEDALVRYQDGVRELTRGSELSKTMSQHQRGSAAGSTPES